MASRAVARTLARTAGRVDPRREHRCFDLLSDELSDAFEPVSAWTFSRRAEGCSTNTSSITSSTSGWARVRSAFCAAALYVETFSLFDYQAAVVAGRTGVTGFRQFSRRDQMRYRFLMELFGMRLDKRRFLTDFGRSRGARPAARNGIHASESRVFATRPNTAAASPRRAATSAGHDAPVLVGVNNRARQGAGGASRWSVGAALRRRHRGASGLVHPARAA